MVEGEDEADRGDGAGGRRRIGHGGSDAAAAGRLSRRKCSVHEAALAKERRTRRGRERRSRLGSRKAKAIRERCVAAEQAGSD
jgi:hypothetical protein